MQSLRRLIPQDPSGHVAVSLFLTGKYGGLKLYLPASFDEKTCAYTDTGVVDWRVNPGGTSNYYYKAFSTAMGRNMLEDIKLAIKKGAMIDVPTKGSGFHGPQGPFRVRNTLVAKSRLVIAFTFGEGSEPDPKGTLRADGGTADTWKKVSKESSKIHVSLESL